MSGPHRLTTRPRVGLLALALPVIVQAVEGMLAEARAAVIAAGGTVVTGLPLVNGFSARIGGTSLPAVAADWGTTAAARNPPR